MKNIKIEDRAYRGGSWFNSSWSCRASYRFRGGPGYRSIRIGFRVLHRRRKA